MKLQDSLFKVLSHQPTAQGHDFNIRLDEEHFIYKAHFPGEPITPGVCIMQIALELFEVAVEKPLTITCVKNVKFLRVVTPHEVPELCYSLQKISEEDGNYKTQVVVSAPEGVYAKLSLICKVSD